MKSKHIPLRKCVACKKVMEKNQLVRIVKKQDGDVIIDLDFKEEGRGTYICKNDNCIETARRKNILNKFLKTQVNDEIYDKIKMEIIKN